MLNGSIHANCDDVDVTNTKRVTGFTFLMTLIQMPMLISVFHQTVDLNFNCRNICVVLLWTGQMIGQGVQFLPTNCLRTE